MLSNLSLDEMLDIADEHNVDPCNYCNYRHMCNHNGINNYGRGPVESPCAYGPDKWVNEDELRELLDEILEESTDGTDNR